MKNQEVLVIGKDFANMVLDYLVKQPTDGSYIQRKQMDMFVDGFQTLLTIPQYGEYLKKLENEAKE